MSTPSEVSVGESDEELARRLQEEDADAAFARALAESQQFESTTTPQTPPSTGRTWKGWFQESAAAAGEAAKQAQETAAIHAEKLSKAAIEAKKAALEHADKLVEQANEFRQNYDMQLATSVLMTSMGATPLSSSSMPSSNKKTPGGSPIQLDLEYITENVIAMAFPYDPKKPGNAQGGNDINAVAAFLRKKHQGHFMVWNISEEPYDASLFADQVLEYKFPGHPAPPLGLLFKICTSVESWLDADEENVAVVHCLTGKGRTAALVACILTWNGEFSSPMEALQYVAERKGISVDYLTIPSQRRYVQYFSNMLDGVKPRSEPLLLRRVIINSIPIFGDNASGPENLGCCPYLQLFKGGRLIATATPPDTDNQGSDKADKGDKKKQPQLKWIKASEGSVSFTVDCAVQGDILLRCRHAESSGSRLSMFRAAFHTGYAPSGVLRLTKAQLDGSVSDPRFHDDFFIDLIFAPIEKSPEMASSSSSSSTSGGSGAGDSTMPANAIGIVGEPSDSGLVIDASSADRYELTLHRDTRFWEAVAARKSKSKKRQSRKFVSSSQDQFSISDDISGHGETKEPKPASAPRPTSKAVGNMSDLELIMQLARAEEDSMGEIDAESGPPMPTLNIQPMGSMNAGSTAAATLELQALEDLEKELGLDDLQLFTNMEFSDSSGTRDVDSSVAASSGTKAAAAPSAESEDLDELEQYLSSLSK